VSRIPLREGLFSLAADGRSGRLQASRCDGCRRHSFPAQSTCPYCGSEACPTIELGSRGVLEVCTTVVNRPPGYEGPMPFGFGVVELPEGLRIIARIQRPQQAHPGGRVSLVFETLTTDEQGREIVTYAFQPEG